jgi:5'-nucleotidase
MKILLTNDDGYEARGLWALWRLLEKDHDLYVCAPEREQSGASHRLTLDRPLRATPLKKQGRGWFVNGTPADCVKLALRTLINEEIDLVISGINRGSNAGILVHYSGTVAAAKEAVTMGYHAMAVSLCGGLRPDYEGTAKMVMKLLKVLEGRSLPPMTFLNVNAPNIPYEEIKGFRVVPMSLNSMRDGYESRVDPRGRNYYWLSAELNFEQSPSFDDHKAVGAGYVAVSPLTLDWTNRPAIDQLMILEGEK